ncbi:hypothetical protein A2U01_0056421, partial [Trifolium medium]|nr:hypothetical protein [Trifolium medium]
CQSSFATRARRGGGSSIDEGREKLDGAMVQENSTMDHEGGGQK